MEGTHAEKTREVTGLYLRKGLTLIFSKLRKSWDPVVGSKNPKANSTTVWMYLPKPWRVMRNAYEFFLTAWFERMIFSINSSEGPLGHCYPPEAMMGTWKSSEIRNEIPGVEPGFTGEFPWWGTEQKETKVPYFPWKEILELFNKGILISWFIIIPTITWGV